MSGLFLCHFCNMKTRIPGFTDLRKWGIFLLVISLLCSVLFGYFSKLAYQSFADLERLLFFTKFSPQSIRALSPLFLFVSALISAIFLIQLIRKSYGLEFFESEPKMLDDGLVSSIDKIRIKLTWWVLYAFHGFSYSSIAAYMIYLVSIKSNAPTGTSTLFVLLECFGVGSIAYLVSLIRSSSVTSQQ